MNILDLRDANKAKYEEALADKRDAVIVWTTFIGLLVLGIAYLYYLQSGCALDGVMAWGGKVCVESL